MPPALQAGRALPLRSEKLVDQKTEKDTIRMSKVRIVGAALLAMPLLLHFTPSA
jgi:predicted lipoprotein